ncbi:NAD(P)-binding protein [Periconia macrospinosa]|uniref:NAD(P)-binding protein n=1 Tax=Periconia macrospinosa TaxID=97972 RepID=A0A2V1DRA5_9PLEO|nr:NAD(P)-binding protein [Periconia macrospinosa]
MSFKQTFTEFFPPQPTITEKDLPPLSGKTYLVTGGAAGVGKELCRMLYSAGARVFVVGRSLANIQHAIKDIVEGHGQPADDKSAPTVGRMTPVVLDLADLPSIKPAIDGIKRDAIKIDTAFLNAGVMSPPSGSKTKQGYELQWGTNVVGHFLLQRLLLPLLLTSAQENGEARVVWASSDSIKWSPKPDGIFWDNINDMKKSPMALYAQSKAAVIILATETSRRYGEDGIVTASLNPGHLKTELQRHVNSHLLSLINATLLYEARYGALTELFAGFSHSLSKESNGKYFIPWGREGKIVKHVRKGLDNGSGNRLWELLVKETEEYM